MGMGGEMGRDTDRERERAILTIDLDNVGIHAGGMMQTWRWDW